MSTIRRKEELSAWALLLVGAFIDTLSITVIKVYFNIIGEIDLSSAAAAWDYAGRYCEYPWAVGAVAVLMISPVLPFIAISRLHLSLGYPVLAALHLLFIELFSHLLLHEPAELKKAVGVLFILISIYFFYQDSMTRTAEESE